MTEPRITEKTNKYERLFKICLSFVGQTLDEVIFYLDKDDLDFSEQPNE